MVLFPSIVVALIYYTGYGEEGTGNWCFKDGTISFLDIFTLYKKYLTGKLLYIATDCSYSGQWVVECAKCLDEMGIGACGHQTREQEILIKVWASCEPQQKATFGAHMTQDGLMFDIYNKTIYHDNCKRLSNSQTTYGCDFTWPTCTEPLSETCRLQEIQHTDSKYSWKWEDVVSIDKKKMPLCHLVRYTGEQWFYVLLENGQEESLKSQVDAGHIDTTNIKGFIIAHGWGKNPPNHTREKVITLFPSYIS